MPYCLPVLRNRQDLRGYLRPMRKSTAVTTARAWTVTGLGGQLRPERTRRTSEETMPASCVAQCRNLRFANGRPDAGGNVGVNLTRENIYTYNSANTSREGSMCRNGNIDVAFANARTNQTILAVAQKNWLSPCHGGMGSCGISRICRPLRWPHNGETQPPIWLPHALHLTPRT